MNLLCLFMKIVDTFPRVLFDLPSRFFLQVIQENESRIMEQASRLPLSFPFDPDIFEEQKSIGLVDLPFQASEFPRLGLPISRTPTILPTLTQRSATVSSSSLFAPTSDSSLMSSKSLQSLKKDKSSASSGTRLGKPQETLLGLNDVDSDLWAATLGWEMLF
jgi:hypothetical protein